MDSLIDRIKRIERRVRNFESWEPKLDYADDAVANPPTSADIDAAFGTPSMVGEGYTAILDNNGAGTNVYLVSSDGTNWWYETLTKAT